MISTYVVDYVEYIDHELVSVSCLPPWQDRESLKDVQAYVVVLLNYRDLLAEQPIQEEELPDDAELVQDSKDAIMIEYILRSDRSPRPRYE